MDWDKPSSIFPAIAIQDIVKIVQNAINSLIISSNDENINSFTDFIYQIKINDYDVIFEEITQESYCKSRKFNNLVLIDIRNIKCEELFTKKQNFKYFRQIRSTLKGNAEWILVLSKDENLLFSLADNHFLTWSVIPSSINEILIAFLM
ncbi:MAG: hypothetical protein ACW964_17680, partial [Candidatus Hodarchaeales archaeon]